MVRWTRLALKDLEAQLDYIQQENPDVVGRIALQIKTATDSLNTFPHLGRDGVVPGTKELLIPQLPFICVYRLRDGWVEILRLLHERMQWPR